MRRFNYKRAPINLDKKSGKGLAQCKIFIQQFPGKYGFFDINRPTKTVHFSVKNGIFLMKMRFANE